MYPVTRHLISELKNQSIPYNLSIITVTGESSTMSIQIPYGDLLELVACKSSDVWMIETINNRPLLIIISAGTGKMCMQTATISEILDTLQDKYNRDLGIICGLHYNE